MGYTLQHSVAIARMAGQACAERDVFLHASTNGECIIPVYLPVQGEVISSLYLRRQLSGSQEVQQGRSPRPPSQQGQDEGESAATLAPEAQWQQQQQQLRESASFHTAQPAPGLRDSTSFYTAQQTLAGAAATPPRVRAGRQLPGQQHASEAAGGSPTPGPAGGAAGVGGFTASEMALELLEETASPSPTSRLRPATRGAALGGTAAGEEGDAELAASRAGGTPGVDGAGLGGSQQRFITPHASLLSLDASMNGLPTPGACNAAAPSSICSLRSCWLVSVSC